MLIVPGSEYRFMVDAAQRADPLEACGLLVMDRNATLIARELSNVIEREHQYGMDSEEMVAAFTDAESRGGRIVGIWHTHPNDDAYPSELDIEMAHYPDMYWVIVNKDGVRSFMISDGVVAEDECVVSDTKKGTVTWNRGPVAQQ